MDAEYTGNTTCQIKFLNPLKFNWQDILIERQDWYTTIKKIVRNFLLWPILSDQMVNPHTPVAQKLADEVVFRHFQGEGVEFF